MREQNKELKVGELMSDLIEQIAGLGQQTGQICRVAYTLNNMQPVVSTIIGSQPLFYMDYAIEDDDEFFDAADLNILEEEIAKLKHSIESFEKQYDARDFNNEKSAEATLELFAQNAKGFCGAIDRVDAKTRLANVKNMIVKSRIGAAYLDFAAKHGVDIALSAQTDVSSYDRHSGLIQINPHQSFEDMVLCAVTELRRHWQHRAGALIHPLLFHPDNAILINRAQVTDLSVAMIRVAWELQLAGEKSVWERLENSPMSDLARAFAREAFLDFRTINNGIASAAVFETWFLSERCRIQDKTLIQQMLSDYQGYMFDAENNAQSLTAGIIAALGTMPYGKNYLAQHANTIMEDAIFTDVRDRSNANFLWFIKFERSFRETEQELQSTVEPTAKDSRHGTSKDISEVLNNEQPQDAEIITLPGAARIKQKGTKRLCAKTLERAIDSKKVINIAHWSTERAIIN